MEMEKIDVGVGPIVMKIFRKSGANMLVNFFLLKIFNMCKTFPQHFLRKFQWYFRRLIWNRETDYDIPLYIFNLHYKLIWKFYFFLKQNVTITSK